MPPVSGLVSLITSAQPLWPRKVTHSSFKDSGWTWGVEGAFHVSHIHHDKLLQSELYLLKHLLLLQYKHFPSEPSPPLGATQSNGSGGKTPSPRV